MHFSVYSGILNIYFDNTLQNYNIRKVMPAWKGIHAWYYKCAQNLLLEK